MITETTVLVLKSDLIYSDTQSEIVIMDIASGKYLGLDPVASDIFRHLTTPTKVADLVTDLVDAYAVDPTTCMKDTLALLKNFDAKGLIDLIPGS